MPFVTDGSVKVRVPKDQDAEALTKEQCLEMIANAPPPKGKKAPAKKKATTKKAAAKKPAAKKTAAKKVTSKKTNAKKAPARKAAPKKAAPARSRKPKISEDEKRMMIAMHAYYKWENAGFPGGQDWSHWLEAEREVEAMLK